MSQTKPKHPQKYQEDYIYDSMLYTELKKKIGFEDSVLPEKPTTSELNSELKRISWKNQKLLEKNQELREALSSAVKKREELFSKAMEYHSELSQEKEKNQLLQSKLSDLVKICKANSLYSEPETGEEIVHLGVNWMGKLYKNKQIYQVFEECTGGCEKYGGLLQQKSYEEALYRTLQFLEQITDSIKLVHTFDSSKHLGSLHRKQSTPTFTAVDEESQESVVQKGQHALLTLSSRSERLLELSKQINETMNSSRQALQSPKTKDLQVSKPDTLELQEAKKSKPKIKVPPPKKPNGVQFVRVNNHKNIGTTKPPIRKK